jgi:hypothetical protein
MRTVVTTSRDRHGVGTRVDAVLDKLRDRFERVGLGEGDDANGVPIISDPELAALVTLKVSWLPTYNTASNGQCSSRSAHIRASLTARSRGRRNPQEPSANLDEIAV